MNARELITRLSLDGAKFEVEGEGFRLRAPRGLISERLREALEKAKPEIVALLRLTDTEITVSQIAGNCPHCKQPLLVFTYPLDDEVWIQCPTNPELFKALRHTSPAWCSDCKERLPVIAGRCAECIQRVMLASDQLCESCTCRRFWRHLASRNKPAGFAWYCIDCKEPSGKVIVYELTERGEDDQECLNNAE